jgi:hypothetical protein
MMELMSLKFPVGNMRIHAENMRIYENAVVGQSPTSKSVIALQTNIELITKIIK